MDYDESKDAMSSTYNNNSSFQVRPWDTVDLYDIRHPITRGLETVTMEEIIVARDVVIFELVRLGHEQYKPRLLLMDNKNKSHLAIIHVIHDEEHQFDGEENRSRTFWVQNGQIVAVIPGRKRHHTKGR